ncbi:hypothetical protein [Sphingopyxis sp. PET50]|uniref:hypothetical protein n=1 Tax=Sphingopyxis sp. PET50 TaxID=2976533 RepID=UPI0028AE59F7|nr:hypothetical protein [Sphingopyxis sp. PET50]
MIEHHAPPAIEIGKIGVGANIGGIARLQRRRVEREVEYGQPRLDRDVDGVARLGGGNALGRQRNPLGKAEPREGRVAVRRGPMVKPAPRFSEQPAEDGGHRDFKQAPVGAPRPPGIERHGAIIGAMAGTVIEARAHRRVAAEAEIGEHRRAVGTEAIAPGTIDGRSFAEAVANRIAQCGHLGALQFGRQVAGIAVALVHLFVVRRRDPGMQLRPDLAPPRRARFAEDRDGTVIGDDRPVDEIDGRDIRGFEIALAIGQRGNRIEPVSDARKGCRPVEVLFGVDGDPETRLFVRSQPDQIGCRGRL